MRLTGLRSLLFWAVAVLAAGFMTGCDNPFDPLNTSDKIQGLAYFDFSASLERWDSDPEMDGLEITLAYYNELGDQLNFHDKPHEVQIEFYSDEAVEGEETVQRDLLTTTTIEFSNSDVPIRVPIEFYGGFLELPSTESVSGCLLVRVFPPEEYPQKELYFFACGIEFFTPEEALLSPP